jgi:hypothetical protein
MQGEWILRNIPNLPNVPKVKPLQVFHEELILRGVVFAARQELPIWQVLPSFLPVGLP